MEPKFKTLSLSGQQGHAVGITPAAGLELPPGRRGMVRVLQYSLVSRVCVCPSMTGVQAGGSCASPRASLPTAVPKHHVCPPGHKVQRALS